MAKAKSQKIELVIVRHSLPAKHGDFDRVEPMIASPFESSGSSASATVAGLSNMRASDRWCAAVEVQGSSWVTLASNVGTSEQLFEANLRARRLEVVWARRDLSTGELGFRWGKARKLQATFLSASDSDPWRQSLKCESRELRKKVLACESASAAFDLFCQHLQIDLPLPRIDVDQGKYVFIGRSGKPVQSGLKRFKIITASGLAAGEDLAAESLANAIDAGDVAEVRELIANGVSLDALPETSLTPLGSALLRCGETKAWREVAQMLVDAGAALEDGSQVSLVHTAGEHFIAERLSIEMLQFLLDNGAEVDTPDANGWTLLRASALRKRDAVVRWLLDNGADPNRTIKGELSIIDEVRRRFERNLKYSDTSEYAATLELLTGESVALPEPKVLTEAERLEAERFLAIAKAEAVGRLLPPSIKLRRIKVSRLARMDGFDSMVESLDQLGFQEAGHCIVTVVGQTIYSGFVNEELGMDAVLSDDGMLNDGTVRLELAAYHDNDQLTIVTNKPFADDPELPLQRLHRHFLEATPASLVRQLKAVVKKAKRKPVSRATFLDRFKQALEMVLVDSRNAATRLASHPIQKSDGTLPRFERLGFRLNVQPDQELSQCVSTSIAETSVKDLEAFQADSSSHNWSAWQLQGVVDASTKLAALDHLEMAGAPNNPNLYAPGVDAAQALFAPAASAGRNADRSGDVMALSQGLALAMKTDRWDAVAGMCSGIGASFASADRRMPGDPPLAISQWQVLFAGRFRKRKSPKSKSLRAAITKSRSKEAKLLLIAMDALDAHESAEFKKAIDGVLANHASQSIRHDYFFDFDRAIAWHASLLVMTAGHEGVMIEPSAKTSDPLFC